MPAPGRLVAEGADDGVGVPELRDRGLRRPVRIRLADQLSLVGLLEAIGDLGEQGRRQPGGQCLQLAGDQRVVGHGSAPRTAETAAANVVHPPRSSRRARRPRAVRR